MNNLLFACLIIALLYYFFYYLPQQKKLTNPNLTHAQFTQTDPDPTFANLEAELHVERSKRKELELTEKDYQQKLKDYQTQIINLQTEIRELVKRPLKPTNSKGTQTDSDLENTLDTLIKDIQQLNNSLC